MTTRCGKDMEVDKYDFVFADVMDAFKASYSLKLVNSEIHLCKEKFLNLFSINSSDWDIMFVPANNQIMHLVLPFTLLQGGERLLVVSEPGRYDFPQLNKSIFWKELSILSDLDLKHRENELEDLRFLFRPDMILIIPEIHNAHLFDFETIAKILTVKGVLAIDLTKVLVSETFCKSAFEKADLIMVTLMPFGSAVLTKKKVPTNRFKFIPNLLKFGDAPKCLIDGFSCIADLLASESYKSCMGKAVQMCNKCWEILRDMGFIAIMIPRQPIILLDLENQQEISAKELLANLQESKLDIKQCGDRIFFGLTSLVVNGGTEEDFHNALLHIIAHTLRSSILKKSLGIQMCQENELDGNVPEGLSSLVSSKSQVS